MMLHNAKTDKPTKDGDYICLTICKWTDHKGNVHKFVSARTDRYNAEMDGWNVSQFSGKEYEIFPDAWMDQPTVEDVEKVLKGERNV